MEEIWKPIPNWPSYFASSLGRIKGPRKILKLPVSSDGYQRVGMSRGPIKRVYPPHQLVCMAFHGMPPFEGAQALHKNGIKTDIVPDNLYWGTHAQNMQDMVAHGGSPVGTRNPNAKLDWSKVREIRRRATLGETASNLARELGVWPQVCSKIIRNKAWKEEKTDD